MDQAAIEEKLRAVREKLVRDQARGDALLRRVNKSRVEEMLRAFQVNTDNCSILDIIEDPDAYSFVSFLAHAVATDKINAIMTSPKSGDAKLSQMYYIGILVGVYLAELDLAKVIFRTK